MLGKEKFDLIVIGHRFPKGNKHELAMKAKGKVAIVLVCGASADEEIPADARVYGLEGNEGLLTCVKRLLPTGIPATAA